ncbi:MAG: type II secretion system protein [Verrucomicrobiaceae bacterium]|nr:MAG: type II secretion system protein [Verrucomicrobiaceae bacterium]
MWFARSECAAGQGGRGFTRIQLMVALVLTGIVAAAGLLVLKSKFFPAGKKFAANKSAKAIYTWLQAYANEHDQEFPQAKDFSNEAFRQLFVMGYLDDETTFAIPGDAWLNHAPGGRKMPDNRIGSAPDFAEALQPGECSYFYVTGLDAADQSNLPLLGNAFSETVGVYSKDKTKKGGILYPKAVWVSVGGAARIIDVGEDLRARMAPDGKETPLFPESWGTKIKDVKNPAP